MKLCCTLFFLFLAILLAGGEVKIYCTTDLHGRAERLLFFASALRDTGGVIRIDNGDTLQGTLLSAHSKGQIMITLLNEFKFHVWVPGNHDFDFGTEALLQASRRFKGVTLGAEYSRSGFQPKPWVMLTRNNYKIAVIGMTDPKMPSRLLPDSGWEFADQRETLRKIMPEILDQSPNLIVLAWHAGLHSPPGSLFRFLSEFPEIELVIGGHSHEEIPGRKIGNAYYIQPAPYGNSLAKVTVTFDKAGAPSQIRSELLRHENIKGHRLAHQIAPYYNRYTPFAKEIVGVTEETLRLPEKGDNTLSVSRLGAEALLAAAPGATASLFQVSPIPQIVIAKEVTREGLFKLLPHENELCTVELTADEFRRLLTELSAGMRKGYAVSSFAGVEVRKDAKGNLIASDLPERITLVLTAFALTRDQILPARVKEGKWKRLGIMERDAVADYLSKPSAPRPKEPLR